MPRRFASRRRTIAAMASSYTAKDITVLEGLEPVRKRPGMYIGGVGAAGLHHLVWEILDNSIDEAMNGHASNIAVTLHKDGSSITVDRRRPRHPRRHASEDKKTALEVIFTALHAGGKFERAELQDGRRSPRRRRLGRQRALDASSSPPSSATAPQWEMRFKQGKPAAPLKKLGAARGSGTTVFFHPDPDDLPEDRVRPGDHPRAARGRQLPAPRLKVTFDDESDRTRRTRLQARRRHRRVPEEDRRRARRQAGARAPFTL